MSEKREAYIVSFILLVIILIIIAFVYADLTEA